MDQKKIGKFLKELRNEKELTQEELAEALNVSNRTISRWETGSNMPDISLLVDIAEYFNVSIHEIINGERKSEPMNEGVKEVASTLSNYANEEKCGILTRVRLVTIIGLITLIIGLILDLFVPKTDIPIVEFLRGACFGLGIGALVANVLYTTGLLDKLHTKKGIQIKALRLAALFICGSLFVAAIVASFI